MKMIQCDICLEDYENIINFLICKPQCPKYCGNCYKKYIKIKLENSVTDIITCDNSMTKDTGCNEDHNISFLIRKFDKDYINKHIKPYYFKLFEHQIYQPKFKVSNQKYVDLLIKYSKKYVAFEHEYGWYVRRSEDKNTICKDCVIIEDEQMFNKHIPRKNIKNCLRCSDLSFVNNNAVYQHSYEQFTTPAKIMRKGKEITIRVPNCTIKKANDVVFKFTDHHAAMKTKIQEIQNECFRVENVETKKLIYDDYFHHCSDFLSGLCEGYNLKINGKCFKCNKERCLECYEAKDQDHKCDPRIAETISYFKSIERKNNNFINENTGNTTNGTATQCPKCWIFCEKKNGCDVVWCLLCHTTFDWKTRNLLNIAEHHNPDYAAFRQKNKISVRENNDFLRGGMPRYLESKIMNDNLWSKINGIHTRASHFLTEDLPFYRETYRSTLTDEHVKKFLIEVWRKQIISKEYLFSLLWDYELYKARLNEILNVLEIFTPLLTDYFNNYNNRFNNSEFKDSMDFEHLASYHLTELEKIIEEVNNKLNLIQDKYGNPLMVKIFEKEKYPLEITYILCNINKWIPHRLFDKKQNYKFEYQDIFYSPDEHIFRISVSSDQYERKSPLDKCIDPIYYEVPDIEKIPLDKLEELYNTLSTFRGYEGFYENVYDSKIRAVIEKYSQ